MTTTELTPDDIAPIAEMSAAEAWADMLLAAPPEISKEYGIRLTRLDSAAEGMVAKFDLPLLNRTIGLGVLEPTTEAQVEAAIRDYRQANLAHFEIQLSPFAQPSELPEWLQARGLAPRGDQAVVFRGASPPPEAHTDFHIQKIGVDRSGDFADIACKLFDIPPELEPWLIALVGRPRWNHYVALDGNQVVATAALFVDGNVGWTWFAATLPSHRRRGAQTALLAERIRDGVTMGCDWFVSECDEETAERPSLPYHNLLRNGFRLAYLRPGYQITAS